MAEYYYGNGYRLPMELYLYITSTYKKCVYCGKEMKEGPYQNKATVEHFDYISVLNPEKWNVVLCCGSCNSSNNQPITLLEWFGKPYCLEKGINESTVAQVVRDYLARRKQDPEYDIKNRKAREKYTAWKKSENHKVDDLYSSNL